MAVKWKALFRVNSSYWPNHKRTNGVWFILNYIVLPFLAHRHSRFQLFLAKLSSVLYSLIESCTLDTSTSKTCMMNNDLLFKYLHVKQWFDFYKSNENWSVSHHSTHTHVLQLNTRWAFAVQISIQMVEHSC